ncbi:MAG: family 20 glycosylhydrolase [Candidatus Eremiobacteraeota bacterium]|nr:family 20 glycosylhydrolase [Candidatus Eremiobacteraeota bacterium]
MRNVSIAMLAFLFLIGAAPAESQLPLVPQPVKIAVRSGSYMLPRNVAISAQKPDEVGAAAFAAAFLRGRNVGATIVHGGVAQIRFALAPGSVTGNEGYTLSVDSTGIQILANSGAGLYYGLQTLEQLFDPSNDSRSIPYVSIDDYPRFEWRGIHLDVSRHFWDVATVKHYIDIASHYKLNVFHWHLTDDQGWRFESKKYPLLTTIGSCRAGTQAGHDAREINHHRYCAYYTQAQIRDVVAYAKQRYVTVVPEVEMPGHSSAAIAAYPWLSCSGKAIPVSMTWGGSTPVCPTERSIKFEEDILDEVMSLFPSTYIHTGGDEVPYSQWRRSAFVNGLMKRERLQTYPQVQGYFERRIDAYIRSRGRRMMGWDEILDGGVSTTAAIMSWRGTEGGMKGAKRGNDVVMTPDGPLYFDAYQGDPDDEPVAIGNMSTPQMVYAFDPAPADVFDSSQSAHILGVQGNIWTEYIGTTSYLWYMLFPREFALSEIAWSPVGSHNWSSFEARTGNQYAWLECNGYNFRIPNPSFAVDAGSPVVYDNVSPSVRTVSVHVSSAAPEIRMTQPVPGATILYARQGSLPSEPTTTYATPLRIDLAPGATVHIRAVTRLPGGRISTPSEILVTRDL